MARSKIPTPYFCGMKFSASKTSCLHPQDVAELARDTRANGWNWTLVKGNFTEAEQGLLDRAGMALGLTVTRHDLANVHANGREPRHSQANPAGTQAS